MIVNATPLGMAGERLPLPGLTPSTVVVDLVYHPLETPLVEQAKTSGATAFGGIGLLIRQAALSFRVWTGRIPSIEVMRTAAESASDA